MKVKDILSKKGQQVSVIRPDSTISTAANRLKLDGIGAMVVSEDGEQIAGIISERDIVRAMVEFGAGLQQMFVSELMTQSVRTCGPDAAINDVMVEMTRSRIRHLPVVESGKLAGIISIGDVVKNRLEELETETHVLRDYIVGRG